MKALILSGGKGTRLRPITHTAAKQLVPVANRPILFTVLDHIRDAGISEVGMIVGETAAEIEAAVGDGSLWNMNVTYLPQDAPSGLAHAVLIAQDYLGDDEFVMYLGDNLLRDGIQDFVARFVRDRVEAVPSPNAQILLAHVPDPERFGVVELDRDGRVVRLVEKPTNPPSDLALVGVYLFDHHIHEAVRAIQPSARGELEITDAVQWLVDQGHTVNSEVVDGYWKDLGELAPILEGNSLMLERLHCEVLGKVDAQSEVDHRVRVEEGAQIVNSVLRGPALIGPRAVVVNSYVGPFTSVGADCELVDAEIEHSMLLERAKLFRCGRIEESLIGQDAEVTRTGRRPKATRLMVGDHSKVDMG